MNQFSQFNPMQPHNPFGAGINPQLLEMLRRRQMGGQVGSQFQRPIVPGQAGPSQFQMPRQPIPLGLPGRGGPKMPKPGLPIAQPMNPFAGLQRPMMPQRFGVRPQQY